jgi:hypothetical protein
MARVGIMSFGALATALALAGCGSDPAVDRAVKASASPRVSEFVGRVRDSRFLIAIGPQGAGGSRVIAYACDGRGGPGYLLRGRPSGSSINLVSADRYARIQATIRGDHVAGTLSLGRVRHAFRARRARHFGGLYRVTSRTERVANGRSLRRARLRLSLTPDKSRVAVVVHRPEGETVRRVGPLPREARRTSEYTKSWLVLLNDGHGRGGVITSSREAGLQTVFTPPATIDRVITVRLSR